MPRPTATFTAGQRTVKRLNCPTGNAKYVFNTELLDIGNDQVGNFWMGEGRICWSTL